MRPLAGDNCTGSKAVAHIAGQGEEYLARRLRDWTSGFGESVAAMADLAFSPSAEDIAALAHYLSRF
jgi:cytochrome c553